ncbi:MAG: hypothetical protein ACPIOQ_55220, partial [Promethearchaeia archaeon]
FSASVAELAGLLARDALRLDDCRQDDASTAEAPPAISPFFSATANCQVLKEGTKEFCTNKNGLRHGG